MSFRVNVLSYCPALVMMLHLYSCFLWEYSSVCGDLLLSNSNAIAASFMLMSRFFVSQPSWMLVLKHDSVCREFQHSLLSVPLGSGPLAEYGYCPVRLSLPLADRVSSLSEWPKGKEFLEGRELRFYLHQDKESSQWAPERLRQPGNLMMLTWFLTLQHQHLWEDDWMEKYARKSQNEETEGDVSKIKRI